MGHVRLTPKEKRLVIEEMAERMKDVVYMNALDQATRVYQQIPDYHWENPDNKITVDYHFTFVVNDMLQIIGRKRREAE